MSIHPDVVIEGLAADEMEVISAVNRLEEKAFAAEGEPSDIRWEQAQVIAEALESKKTSARKIAAGWRDPETGLPYSRAHVRWVEKSWQVYGHLSAHQRPRWNTAYNSDEVRTNRRGRDDSARGLAPGAEDLDIRRGDFRAVLADIPNDSVPLILTDPPYGDENVPLYVDLAAFAAAKLEEGGSLICYTGHTILPLVLPPMSDLLRYWWLLALDHKSGTRQLPGKWVRAGWKPIMWFVKGSRRDQTYVWDVVEGVKPDKSEHGWAQGVEEVLPVIEALTEPDELVVDPFAGSGAFGIAAMSVGRRFIGADDGS